MDRSKGRMLEMDLGFPCQLTLVQKKRYSFTEGVYNTRTAIDSPICNLKKNYFKVKFY